MTALDTPDLDARKLVYRELGAKGHNPVQFKKTLRYWPPASAGTHHEVMSVAKVLANLDVDKLSPSGGKFPDPKLANLVVKVVPIWKSVTGRSAGPISADKIGDTKKSPFADWLNEMHDLILVAHPPPGRIVDIVRWIESPKKPAPVTAD